MYPKGIRNIGNTCYLNTALQCLGFCHCFLRFMLKDENSVVESERSLLKQLCDLYKISCSEGDKAINPIRLIKVLHLKLNVFMNIFEQNDINEVLTLMIDKLNDEVSRPYDEHHKHYDDKSLFDLQRRKMDISWEQHHRESWSELIPMFYGQMISQIICGNCKAIHHNHEVFMNIMVSLDDATTLQDCLDNFCKDEYIEEGWLCDKCKKPNKSQRSHRFWRVPQILIITVKRFNKNLSKISTSIQVPMYLDIDKHCIPTCPRYMLRSVAFHSGSGFHSGGHYHAVGYDNQQWTIIDDEMVARSDEIPVVMGEGYVFFYEALRSKKA